MTLILMAVSRAISEVPDDECRGRGGVRKLKNKKNKEGMIIKEKNMYADIYIDVVTH